MLSHLIVVDIRLLLTYYIRLKYFMYIYEILKEVMLTFREWDIQSSMS